MGEGGETLRKGGQGEAEGSLRVHQARKKEPLLTSRLYLGYADVRWPTNGGRGRKQRTTEWRTFGGEKERFDKGTKESIVSKNAKRSLGK